MKMIKGPILTSAVAIDEASKIIGSERALAKKIGIHRQRIRYWKNNALLPCEIALKICEATQGKIKLIRLRPDLELTIKKCQGWFL